MTNAVDATPAVPGEARPPARTTLPSLLAQTEIAVCKRRQCGAFERDGIHSLPRELSEQKNQFAGHLHVLLQVLSRELLKYRCQVSDKLKFVADSIIGGFRKPATN